MSGESPGWLLLRIILNYLKLSIPCLVSMIIAEYAICHLSPRDGGIVARNPVSGYARRVGGQGKCTKRRHPFDKHRTPFAVLGLAGR